MPIVRVYYNSEKVTEYGIGLIIQKLRGIVAESFSVPCVPETLLSPGDISVISHKFNPQDIHSHDIEVQIFLANYPARVKYKEGLTQNAFRACAKIIARDYTFYILPIFCEFSFKSFNGTALNTELNIDKLLI